MAWPAQNWIWVLFGIAFVAMHLFGHGGHGGHAGHDAGPTGHGDATDAEAPSAIMAQAATDAGVDPRQLSFKHTVRRWTNQPPAKALASTGAAA